MRTTLFSIIALSFSCSTAFAQSPEYCSVALTERAYDRIDSSVKSRIIFSAKDELCNDEYNSIYEARTLAGKRGFNLGFKGFQIGDSGAKQSGSNKWDISETSFCKASASDLESVFQSDFKSEIASTAVKAWLECVKSSNQNALYIDYDISRDGQLFAGTFRVTANRGPLYRKITGIAVVGEGKETVKCNIAGKWYDPSEAVENPIEIRQTGTAIACEKTGGKGVRVAFQTSVDSTPFIELPSKRGIELAQWEKLEAEISAQKNTLRSEISAAQGIADGTKKRLDALIGRKWVNVLGQRKEQTNYLNNLPYPIEVAVSGGLSSGNFCHVSATVNNIEIAADVDNNPDWGKLCSITFSVPPKGRYSVTTTGYKQGSVYLWNELR